MIYIFEDSKKSILSQIIIMGYPDIEFDWDEGNDRIIEHIIPGNKHVAFVDIMPDNAYTIDTFNKLVDKSTKDTPILPVPLISVEYYYLELCRLYNQIINNEVIEIYRDLKDYREYLNKKGIKPQRNTENFLKFCIKQEITKCTRINNNIPRFIEDECPCKIKYDRCIKCGTHDEKIKQFLKLFPIMPYSSVISTIGTSYTDGARYINNIINIRNQDLIDRGLVNILKNLCLEHYK